MSFFQALISQPHDVYVSNTPTGGEMSPATLLSVISTLPDNTTIYFKKGETFDLSITVDHPLKFDAYGSGAAPIIQGSEDITGLTWTEESSGLWYAVVGSTPYGVVLDGTRGTQAQTGFINIQARPSSTQITGPSATLDGLNTTESLIGADIVAKEFSFRPTFRRQITNYGVGTGVLTFNAQFQNNNAPASGYGFKLLNLKSFVANDRDWAYYSGTGRLYIKSVANPNTRSVRMITEDYGFNISSGVADVEIKNLYIRHYRLEGIYSVSNDNLIISGCEIRQIQLNGISLTGDSDNVLVDNNTIHDCNGNGIHIGGISNSTISNNNIHDIGMQTGISVPYYTNIFRSVGCGIHSRWDETATKAVMVNVNVEYNYIHNVGYLGITFAGTGNNIRYNHIEDFLQKWNDGGGIYCINRPYGTGYETNNCTISNNIISGGTGSLEGIIAESTLHAEGIYVDNGSSYITVDSNQITDVSDYGIFINFDTSFSTVTNNTISYCSTAAITFREDVDFDYGPYNPTWSITFPNNEGNICTGNTMVATSTSQVCMHVYSQDGDTNFNPFAAVDGGDSDNNKYVSPYRGNVAQHNSTLYTLAGWRTKLSDDAASTDLVNYLLYVNSASAAVDILHTLNPTNASANTTPGTNYMKVDKTEAGTESIAAYSGMIFTAEYKVEDTFTGSSVGIASHSPEIGGAWTQQAGTVTINGSGKLVASVAGAATQDVGNKNVTVAVNARVTTTNNVISIMLRYTDENNYIMVQLLVNGASSQVRLINRSGGTNTTLSTANPGVLSANTDYNLKVKVVNSEMWIHMNNVLFINSTSGAWTTNNANGTVHGVRVNTVNEYDNLTIVGGFTS